MKGKEPLLSKAKERKADTRKVVGDKDNIFGDDVDKKRRCSYVTSLSDIESKLRLKLTVRTDL